MGQNVPSLHLTKLGPTVKAARPRGDKDSSLVLHMCNLNRHRHELARLVFVTTI